MDNPEFLGNPRAKKEWSIRKDSILENLKATFYKLVLAIKLFLLEAPVNKAHKKSDLAYSTAYKICNKIREELRARCQYLTYLIEKGRRK